MVSASDAEDLRRAQAEIRRMVEDRMNTVVDYLASRPNLTPEQFRASLIAETNIVVRRFGDIAATMAAEWYDDIRATDRIAGLFRASGAESPYGDAAVDGMVRRAVASVFTEAPDFAAIANAVAYSAGKYVLGASRETIRRNAFRDPASNGYRRVARGETCDFCLMLVGRGGVYKRETAFFASHGRCNCAAVPSWDPDAPEVDVRLYEASRRTPGLSEEQRERHNATVREYLAENQSALRDLLP